MSRKWNIKALPMWEGWSRGRNGSPVYDTWLDEYQKELERHRDSMILDLGCGSRYQISVGKRVSGVVCGLFQTGSFEY